MREFEGLASRCKLEKVLGFLLRGEEAAGCSGEDLDAALDAFWDEVEALYPNVSRRDDRFFSIAVKLAESVEEAAFRAGFLSGFSLSQEIIRAAAEKE